MPLYDFECPSCKKQFEEITSIDETVSCPHCKVEAQRLMSAPSPLKTGAAPYKAGPVHASLSKNINHGSCGACDKKCSG